MAQSTATEIKAESKYIFVVTEQELDDAGYFNIPKSKKHIDKYQNKLKKYNELIASENRNWIELLVLRKGRYRYGVMADCASGFDDKDELSFTPAASAKVKQYLQSVIHKSSCVLDTKNGNCILYASFLTWEDAVNFATFLSNLDLSNYCLYKSRWNR